MIEVPPPKSNEGRTLRYGAMTCEQYIWFRMKWSFFVSVWMLGIAILNLIRGNAFNYALAGILFFSIAANGVIAYSWRNSYWFWRGHLELWLANQYLHDFNERLLRETK